MAIVIKNSKINKDLLEKFYEAFNIKPKAWRALKSYGFPEPEIDLFLEYPEVTDHRLLGMICVLNNYFKYHCWAITVATLKDAILENCIEVVIDKSLDDDVLEQFKHTIQQLFKEGKQK